MGEQLARKVLLIGWDAADWKVMQPLIDAGQLPTVAKFIREGVTDNLATIHPCLSPIVWTSIATGKWADKHGITGFIEPDPAGGGIRPVTSTSRKCKAIWNILTQSGLRSNVVGWFVTHPAEPIDGVVVSDMYSQTQAKPGEPRTLLDGTVHPDRLAQTLAGLRVDPATLPAEDLSPFVPDVARLSEKTSDLMTGLRFALALCNSVGNAAAWLMEREPWDFTAVYYNLIDALGHHFMRYHPPKMQGVSKEDFQDYKDVVAGAYRHSDALLARLLELAGDDCAVVLCSDHGFASGAHRPRNPEAEGSIWHRSQGIVCMRGPHLQAGARIHGATVLDITPTVLTMLGLPVAADMDGRPLLQAIDGPARPEIIPSWEAVPGECGMHPPERREDTFEAHEAIRRLAQLGYIEEHGEDQAKAVEHAVRESRLNLAVTLMSKGRYGDAAPVLEELAAGDPADERCALPLAHCYYLLRQFAKSRRALEPVLAREEGRSQGLLLMSMLSLAEGRVEEALAHLLKVEEANPPLAGVHCQIGALYAQMQRWQNAERAFRRALSIDADNARAHDGLATALMGQERWEEAAEAALDAVGLERHLPEPHYHLGVALLRMGMVEQAAQAFETCVATKPAPIVAAQAHESLALIHQQYTGNRDKAAEHRKHVEELLKDRDTPGPGTEDKP